MSDPVQLEKKYTTRDGREVHLWTVSAKSWPAHPVRGEVLTDGEWNDQMWTESGHCNKHSADISEFDLIPK